MYKILLVEDDFSLANAMKKQIESWGNETRCITDFQNVLKEFMDYKPQLVLLDITLPFFNGYHWCSEIRKVSNVPVVFISSVADNMNIVMAINMGADDFISKPVEPMVLTAKIQAILRRTYEIAESAPVLECHGAILNLNDGSLIYEGNRIELTKNEFRIFEALLECKGKIVSRDQLMTKLWQEDCYVEENTLTVNVGRLRKKLEEHGLKGVIITKPGSGYIIE